MRLVLDASAAIASFEDNARARQILDVVDQAEVVMAPGLIVVEIASVVWKYHQAGLGLPACQAQIEAAVKMVEQIVPCRELYREAFQLAREAKRPAAEMFYLALARREDAMFLTADTALRKEAERQGIVVG